MPCCICLSPLRVRKNVIFLPTCTHKMHATCFMQYFERHNRTCPMCRAVFGSEPQSQAYTLYQKMSVKYYSLLSKIQNAWGRKVLEFKTMFLFQNLMIHFSSPIAIAIVLWNESRMEKQLYIFLTGYIMQLVLSFINCCTVLYAIYYLQKNITEL